MDLIVISDLHLSEGHRKESEKYSPHEDFFFDEEFSRFLLYLEDHRKRWKKHLVIAGDMFDFLQLDGPRTAKLLKETGGPPQSCSARDLQGAAQSRKQSCLIVNQGKEAGSGGRGAQQRPRPLSRQEDGLGALSRFFADAQYGPAVPPRWPCP